MFNGFEKTQKCIDKSLDQLKLGYIDNVLVLWPGSMKVDEKNPQNLMDRHESWRAIENAVEEGKIAGGGVSNFNVNHLEKLLINAKIKPTVN